jgi:hypothetical protein
MRALLQASLHIPMRRMGWVIFATCLLSLAVLSAAQARTPVTVQTQPAVQPVSGSPIAIVPIDSKSDQAATVTGALEVTGGKAIIAASGSIASGSRTTSVILPRRGTLRVCASSTVKLAADASVSAGEMPGLLMAIDHGAVEMSFATTSDKERNADILLTPDFRILIGGPGASEVKVRLGREGDTCVDNSGADAPYVVVTSLFDGGLYRVQPGQRVMFQHGSLHEVVDQEKEPCGCPPLPTETGGNEFPLAQSEGLSPAPAAVNQSSAPRQVGPPLLYSSADHAPQIAENPSSAATAASTVPAAPPAPQKKPGFFSKVGQFFRHLFGAE